VVKENSKKISMPYKDKKKREEKKEEKPAPKR